MADAAGQCPRHAQRMPHAHYAPPKDRITPVPAAPYADLDFVNPCLDWPIRLRPKARAMRSLRQNVFHVLKTPQAARASFASIALGAAHNGPGMRGGVHYAGWIGLRVKCGSMRVGFIRRPSKVASPSTRACLLLSAGGAPHLFLPHSTKDAVLVLIAKKSRCGFNLRLG